MGTNCSRSSMMLTAKKAAHWTRKAHHEKIIEVQAENPPIGIVETISPEMSFSSAMPVTVPSPPSPSSLIQACLHLQADQASLSQIFSCGRYYLEIKTPRQSF